MWAQLIHSLAAFRSFPEQITVTRLRCNVVLKPALSGGLFNSTVDIPEALKQHQVAVYRCPQWVDCSPSLRVSHR